MKRGSIVRGAVMAACLLGAPAHAATRKAAMMIGARVVSPCLVGSMPPLAACHGPESPGVTLNENAVPSVMSAPAQGASASTTSSIEHRLVEIYL